MSIEELKEAHEKGRTIQFRLDGKTWVDWPRPSFDSDPDDYRIKETDKMEEEEKTCRRTRRVLRAIDFSPLSDVPSKFEKEN